MATYSNFEDLEIWKKARIFCQWVNHVIEDTALKSNSRLRNQLEGSSGSIMDNIAEGFERSGNKAFVLYLFYAKGSAGESRSQLYRLLDKGYIGETEFEKQRDFLMDLSQQINRFINYLKKSEHKGWHFKEDQETYITGKDNFDEE